MRFNGRWQVGDDGTPRPVVEGGFFPADGGNFSCPFLVDTGADRTVLSYAAVFRLGVEVETAEVETLMGVGGPVRAIALPVSIQLLSTARELVPLRGRVFGRPYPVDDDACILGRDLLNNFAVVVDWPGKVVALLTGNHRYVIQES